MSSMSLDICDEKENESKVASSDSKSNGKQQVWLWSEGSIESQPSDENVNNSGFDLGGNNTETPNGSDPCHVIQNNANAGTDNNSNAEKRCNFGTNNIVTSTTPFTFGILNNNTDNNATNASNQMNQFAFGTSNNDNPSTNSVHQYTFGTTDTQNNAVPSDTNTNNGWTFGTQNNNQTQTDSNTNNVGWTCTFPSNNTTNNDPFTSSFQTIPSDHDPFATHTQNQTDNNNTNDAQPQQSPPQTPANTTVSNANTTLPTPPVIDERDIDQDAKAAFLAMYAEQHKNQWCCNTCNNYNPFTTNLCESCESISNHTVAVPSAPKTPRNPTNNTNDTSLFAYYDILNKNHEILHYDCHHQPKYFPYDHADKLAELEQETPCAWMQFDEEEDADEDSDVKLPDIAEKDEKVRTYREYKKRRMLCKQQIQAINRDKKLKLKRDEILIAIAGDGSVGGQLGVGNGSVTQIRNNIAPFPIIMSCLLNKKQHITMTATGIMSTAVVTADNEIYVWGLNDKSELTINPKNVDVDVGDDDDQLSAGVAWTRLYAYYYAKITQIYEEKNPAKLEEIPLFVDKLLVKRKTGKIIMSYGDKSEAKDVGSYNQDLIDIMVQQFVDKNKNKKDCQVVYREEVDIEDTAEEVHKLYLKICDKFSIASAQRVALFIPKATEQEIRDRRDRKLDPYKYLQHQNKPILTRSDVKMTDCEYEYEYEQKDPFEEDNFQGTLSCSYWTPANINLPYKMVIKQVSLGGTHMVVLDGFGHVWSSGTFMNDGVIGHHYDVDQNKVIRYQRTLCNISKIALQTNTKYKKLPEIKNIASGANHFLMLDITGNIWTMGVTKLGQRTCVRNTKLYLCPQKISVINNKGDKLHARKVIKFQHIACGNHHNLAVSVDFQLYSWGQNLFIQCGHCPSKCGYNNVVDHPRCVKFYQHKLNVDDAYEKNREIVSDYPQIAQVVAGEHMTVALDTSGGVWSCGRNACGALGRKTLCKGNKDYGIHGVVKTEVEADFMRKVQDLGDICVDWIGCGSVFWFAHDKYNGNVYAFGDSSSGRAGIGQWKYSRGRPVFDKYNMDLMKYEITSANGGSDHCVFTIKRKQALSRRHSTINSNSNSRESSLSLSLDESVMNGFSNLQTENKNKNKKVMPATQPKKKNRKRCRNEMDEIPEENEMIENNKIFDQEPPAKRTKMDYAKTTPILKK